MSIQTDGILKENISNQYKLDKNKINILLNTKINSISKKVLDHTPQLYYIENSHNDTIPKPLGSSVLYSSENNSYLLTAKHVFKHENEWTIGILIKNTFYALEGTKYQSTDDDIDIAIYKLSDILIETLANHYSFLNSTQIDENHKYTKFSSRYLKAGFPISRSKLKKHDKTIRVHTFILFTDIQKYSDNYVYANIPKIRQAFSNKIPVRTMPILTGLSGSGLWYISNLYFLEFKLVAIMIEWDDKNKKYTKGTNINLFMSLIKAIEEE